MATTVSSNWSATLGTGTTARPGGESGTAATGATTWFRCDSCLTAIRADGERFHCATCPDPPGFDLCRACHDAGGRHQTHHVLYLVSPFVASQPSAAASVASSGGGHALTFTRSRRRRDVTGESDPITRLQTALTQSGLKELPSSRLSTAFASTFNRLYAAALDGLRRSRRDIEPSASENQLLATVALRLAGMRRTVAQARSVPPLAKNLDTAVALMSALVALGREMVLAADEEDETLGRTKELDEDEARRRDEARAAPEALEARIREGAYVRGFARPDLAVQAMVLFERDFVRAMSSIHSPDDLRAALSEIRAALDLSSAERQAVDSPPAKRGRRSVSPPAAGPASSASASGTSTLPLPPPSISTTQTSHSPLLPTETTPVPVHTTSGASGSASGSVLTEPSKPMPPGSPVETRLERVERALEIANVRLERIERGLRSALQEP